MDPTRPRSRAGETRRLQPVLLLLAVLLALLLDAACATPDTPEHRELFRDVTVETGLHQRQPRGDRTMSHIQDSTGNGVAVADFDLDGDEDIYYIPGQSTDERFAGDPPRSNALYRNDGDGHFVDVAAEAGVDLDVWSNGAYFADYDNDGDRDLFVTVWGPNVLYRNDGDGTFTDVSAEAGLAGGAQIWSSGAAFADLDGDGDLDLYVANYCDYDPRDHSDEPKEWTWKGMTVFAGPMGLPGLPDSLFRNNGDGSFTDVSAEAGILDAPQLYGLGVVVADLDDDRDPDIYVANDSVANFLWRNDGGLRFTEIGSLSGVAMNEEARFQAGMGTDAADYDGDGRIDLFVTNFSHDWNTLYRNEGGMRFVEATFAAGLMDSYADLAWGTKFFDYDNDGWLDLFVANGHIYPEVAQRPELQSPYLQPNSLYRNLGDGRFENLRGHGGTALDQPNNTRGVAIADFDRDGRLDLLLSQIDASPSLLRNEAAAGGSLRLMLVGNRSNRDAVGARVEWTSDERTRMVELNPFGSFLSQSSYIVHLGLGDESSAGSIRILWPSGEVDTLTDLAAGTTHTVTEGLGVTDETAP